MAIPLNEDLETSFRTFLYYLLLCSIDSSFAGVVSPLSRAY